jgi:SAM-dependent methyltransferase
VGCYRDRIFPRLLESALDRPELVAARRALLARASGRVLEVGPGTGLNVPHYPAALAALAVAGPERASHELLVRRAAERGLALEWRTASAERLPYPDAAFDALVCTLVLCSVPRPRRALAEFRRVLAPGGLLLLIEHVRAAVAWEACAQVLLTPLTMVAGCGCRLHRRTESAVRAAGFAFDWIESGRSRACGFPSRWVLRAAARR